MAIQYSWVISQMNCAIKETIEGVVLDNVVNVIHWRRNATEGTEGESDYYFADNYGAMGLDSPDPNDFILYPNLTQAEVEGWLNEMTEPTPAEIDLNLAENIALQKNPIEETLPLPWQE
tara:strand:- start:411 stop:767 length:357 start_codon:yes stop_codon:yes gene_type:complete